MDLSSYSATELVQHLNSRELTSTECVEFFLNRIDRLNGSLNAFICTSKSALEHAAQIDSKRSAGQPVGRFAGLPVAIKDNICTAGIATTAGSRMLQHFVPPENATVISRLIQADAIIIGKTNLDEFAMGSSNEHSFFGPVINPWRDEHVPGGSSGGSAVSVASGCAPIALGSDTGGSIRQPAAFCGVTGLKPTYGRVSRSGLIAFASSLDQIGPMARSAEDCALMMDLIAGHDTHDATSAHVPVPNYSIGLSESLKGIRLGICREHFENEASTATADSVRCAIEVLGDLGAQSTDIELPHSHLALAAYIVIGSCEASTNLARYDGVRYTTRNASDDFEQMVCQTRGIGLGPEVKKRIMLGTFSLSAGHSIDYYRQATRVRQMIKHDFERVFDQVDLLVGPTTPREAFRMGEFSDDSLAMASNDVFTVSANLAGIPAISIPCGFSENGLPIGFQLQSRAFNEALLLRVAHHFQSATDWHTRRPFP